MARTVLKGQHYHPNPSAEKYVSQPAYIAMHHEGGNPDSANVATGKRQTRNTAASAAVTSKFVAQTNDGGGDGNLIDKQGAVTITLQTKKDDFDEKAEVKVDLVNPDLVVEKILNTLAHKFPPESIVTIAANRGLSSADSSPLGHEESESAIVGLERGASSVAGEGRHRDYSMSGGLFSGSAAAVDGSLSTILGGRKPSRLSGRHYLGADGEYYPEVADSRGNPIAAFVRDPRTGCIFPVGREVRGPDGRAFPDLIYGPLGKPIPGIPLAPEGIDPSGNARPCYDALDGTHPWEAFGADGQPLMGFAIDAHDGQVKPVGPPVTSSDGRYRKGVIRGSNGQVTPGIPLRPVQKVRAGSGKSKAAPQFGRHQMGMTNVSPRSSFVGIGGGQFPGFGSVGGGYPPPYLLPYGSPMAPGASFQMPGAMPYGSMMGTPMGGFGTADGAGTPWNPAFSSQPGGQPMFMPQSMMQQYPPQSPPQTPAYPSTGPPRGAQPQVGGGGAIHPSMDVQGDRRYMQAGSTSMQPAGVASSGIKIPTPAYLLEDGTPAVLAVGPDGRPMDGYAHDPKTGDVIQVGQTVLGGDGRPISGLVRTASGLTVQGLPLAPYGWHAGSSQPLPHYYTRDGEWAPMYVDAEGHPMHGLAKDPRDGQVKPVGIQSIGEQGLPIPGTVIGPDGRSVQGIAVQPVEAYMAGRRQGSTVPQQGVMTGAGGISGGVTGRPGSVVSSTGQQRAQETDADGTPIRYVEVDVVEEKVVEVPGERIVKEIEKRVPKVEVVEVEKIVEVPRIEYVDKTVEIPQIEEVVKEVRVRQVVDRPYDVVVRQPKIETRTVEKIVEVPGEVIEVPRVQRVEQPVTVSRYNDTEVPTVVAQRLQPVIRATHEIRNVPCTITEPKVVTVDVYIPKPVGSVLNFLGKTKELHRTVDVPAAQFNSLIKRLNMNLDEQHWQSLLVKEGAGVPILPAGERVETVEPVAGDWIENHERGKIHCSTATEIPTIHLTPDRPFVSSNVEHRSAPKYGARGIPNRKSYADTISATPSNYFSGDENASDYHDESYSATPHRTHRRRRSPAEHRRPSEKHRHGQRHTRRHSLDASFETLSSARAPHSRRQHHRH